MSRRLLAAALCVVDIALLSTAYYGARALAPMYLLREWGLGQSEIAQWTGWSTGLLTMALLASALPAALVRPRRLVPAAALLAALGAAAIAVAPTLGLLAAGAALLVIGVGLFRVTLFASAGALFERDDEPRAALFCLLYAALNVGAFAGTATLRPLHTAISIRGLLGGFAAILLISTALALPSALLAAPHESQRPAARQVVAPWVATAGLVLLGIPIAMAGDVLVAYTMRGPDSMSLFSVNPIAVVITCVPVAALLLGLALRRIRLPVALPISAGLVLTAASCLLPAILGPSRPVLLISFVAGGAGELANALILSRIAAGLPWRVQSAALAAWAAEVQIVSWFDVFLTGSLAGRGLLVTVGVVCLLVAIGTAISFRWLDRAFSPERPPVAPTEIAKIFS